MSKRLFRQEHPILFGLMVLGVTFMVFLGGITFFIAKSIFPQKTDIFKSPGVGIITLEGVILSSDQIIAELTEFRENENIKAIVIRIDSPGGAVGASQEIFDEIEQTSKSKPVIASMASVAASGGYYAALGANKIIANPGTLTGSIGVIIKFANLQKILDKVGYQSEVIKSGKHKDIGSFARPITEDERLLMQSLIDDVHEQFVLAVSEARDLPIEQVRDLADGRIYTGKQAKEHGLIDRLGNFTVAATLAAELAGLETKNLNLVYPKKSGFSILKTLAGEKSQAVFNRFIPSSPALMYEWSLAR